MATTYVDGAANMVRGIPNTEDHVKPLAIDVDIDDPLERTTDSTGAVDGFIHGFRPEVRITIEGETNDDGAADTDAMTQILFGLKATIANLANNKYTDPTGTPTFHGLNVSDFTMDGTVSYREQRDGVRTFRCTYVGWPGVTIPLPA